MSTGRHRPSSSNTFHILAGLTSGFSSAVLLQPVDLLKTRVQQSGSTSLLATFTAILRAPHPVRSLWRGTVPSAIRTSLGSALYFTSLNALRTRFAAARSSASASTSVPRPASSSALPQLPLLGNLASGALARAGAGFVMMPVTVLKVRYESSFYAYRSLPAAARAILATEGLRGFFAGSGATALRDAPYAGLYVVFYERGKVALARLFARDGRDDEGGGGAGQRRGRGMGTGTAAAVNFSSSVVAAAAATALTNPPDAVKTRLQVSPGKYRNTVQATRLMLREEGVRSLFDGLALRMARKAMSSALAWTVYEEVIRRAESRFSDQGEA